MATNRDRDTLNDNHSDVSIDHARNLSDGIYLENIQKSYGKDLVFSITDGQILHIPFEKTNVIFGYSGSGKTTLVNIISLLDLPDLIDLGTETEPKLVIVRDKKFYRVTYWKWGPFAGFKIFSGAMSADG